MSMHDDICKVLLNEEEIKEIKPLKTSQSENTAWQSKDFLELDDDMEFEFLDL